MSERIREEIAYAVLSPFVLLLDLSFFFRGEVVLNVETVTPIGPGSVGTLVETADQPVQLTACESPRVAFP